MIDAETGWYFVPASIKAVVTVGETVLLCHNPRSEWELPGGWPQKGDRRLADTVEREVLEECGLRVKAGELLHAGLLEVLDEPVTIVALHAVPDGAAAELVHSTEHSEVRFFPLDALPDALPQIYRDAISAAAAG